MKPTTEKAKDERFDRLVEERRGNDVRRYVRTKSGKKVRIRSTTDIGSPAFIRDYQTAWNDQYDVMGVSVMESALLTAMRHARSRAKNLGRPFNLTLGYIIKLYTRQDGMCAVSGIQFDLRYAGDSRVNPYKPSIDRLDNGRGYTKGNVRLTLHAVNIALSDMPEEDYIRVCAAVAKNRT